MIDSVILVMVRSRLRGRRFLTPEMSESMFREREGARPVSFREWVSRVERVEREGGRKDEVGVGLEGGAVSIVRRVVVRTLGMGLAVIVEGGSEHTV